MSLFSKIRSKSYETQIVLLVAFLGIARLVLAVAIDVAKQTPNAIEIITDSALLFLFIGLLFLTYTKATFKSIHPSFGFILTILLGLNFIEFNGIFGFTRFNFYCGFFVIGLLYNSRWLIIHITFQSIIMILLAYGTAHQLSWLTKFSLGNNLDITEFIFAVTVLGILAFYLKNITVHEINKYDHLNVDLSKNVRQAKQTNQLLITKTKELREAQQNLALEVSKRTKLLDNQQKAIESYIYMNTSVLHAPMDELNKAIELLPVDQPLSAMLLASRIELNEVLRSIKNTLDAQQELDRNKIRQS